MIELIVLLKKKQTNKIESFAQINETEQDRLRREKDKQEIMLLGTQTLIKCCRNRLASFNELLTNSAKPKVTIL